MKAIRPGQYKFISFLAIFFTVLGGLFFLVLIPLVVLRDLKFAGVLLVMGIAIFALGILITLTALVFLFLKMPKQ
jgi:hypothetical protein